MFVRLQCLLANLTGFLIVPGMRRKFVPATVLLYPVIPDAAALVNPIVVAKFISAVLLLTLCFDVHWHSFYFLIFSLEAARQASPIRACGERIRVSPI